MCYFKHLCFVTYKTMLKPESTRILALDGKYPNKKSKKILVSNFKRRSKNAPFQL